ncbi:hypothetical protein CNR22_19695 [Sphingobacteriaceae bacterium]|nr:hypothetical protein CNR22_19695 [Sphingobacteriaceae bacterium]
MADSKLIELLTLLIPEYPEAIHQLENNFEKKSLNSGDVILNAGEICNAFYVVEKGHLYTCYLKDGINLATHFHFEGNIISDHRNAKAGIPSSFSLKAGEKSEVWILNRKQLEALCYSNDEMMTFGRRLVARMALDLQDDSTLLKIYSPTERYAYIKEHAPNLLQRVSVSNLASYLGMNRRTITRIRAKK